MRIAIAQVQTHAGDFEATVRRAAQLSAVAASKGADLMVLPACALTGTGEVPYADREGLALDLVSAVLSLAGSLECRCLVPVQFDVEDAHQADALLLGDGRIVDVRLGAALGSDGVVPLAGTADGDDGGEGPDAGSPDLPCLDVAGCRLGVAFDYEELDEYVARDHGVDAIVFLSDYGYALDDPSSAMGTSLSQSRFPRDAQDSGCWLVGVGSLGTYDGRVHCGSSFVMAPWGQIAAQSPCFEEDLLVCDVDPSCEGPLPDPLREEVYDPGLMTWEALVHGLRDAVAQGGARGACAVVDSSLQSQVVAALAVDALGPQNVFALRVAGVSRTRDAAASSPVSALRLPEGNVEVLDASVAGGDTALLGDLAQAHLAALARSRDAVPLGCQDKTGLALEGASRASAARIEPLGDLYRSDVLDLARMRNTVSPVICREAQAGLGHEDALPPRCGIVGARRRLEFCDAVLAAYLEWEDPVSDIVESLGHEAAVLAVIDRLRSNEALRPSLARVLCVTSRTLEEGRAPLGMAWRDRVRPADERLEAVLARADGDDDGAAGDDVSDPEEALEAREHERDMREVMGYLRDFSLGGALSGPSGPSAPASGRGPRPDAGGQGPAADSGPDDGPTLWTGPFSLN